MDRPTPSQKDLTRDPKYREDFARLTYAIQQSTPEAVEQAVRDNSEKCILGSGRHRELIPPHKVLLLQDSGFPFPRPWR